MDDLRVGSRIIEIRGKPYNKDAFWVAGFVVLGIFAAYNLNLFDNPFRKNGDVVVAQAELQSDVHELKDDSLRKDYEKAKSDRMDALILFTESSKRNQALTNQNQALLGELQSRDLTSRQHRSQAIEATKKLSLMASKSNPQTEARAVERVIVEYIVAIQKGCRERKRDQDCTINY